MRPCRLLLAVLALLLALPPRVHAETAPPPLCFADVPAIRDCVAPAFAKYWQRNGGLAVFGYPLTPALPEETEGGLLTVQYFERYRLELHPEAPAPYTIQLGRSGADRLLQLGRAPDAPAPAASGCRLFAATGQAVCEPFLGYWRSHGLELGDPGLSERENTALLGLPLTAPAVETNSSGDQVLTQWFERARLELHGAAVLQGRLAVEVEQARTPIPPAPGFVEIVGSQLLQGGQPIALKGLNYYPAGQPWSLMWTQWSGPVVEQELARARRELGINTIRVLVPYRQIEGWTDDRGNVSPAMLGRLRELVQIAGEHEIKVLVTLFDWQFDFAAASTAEEGYDLSYLRTIVGAFKDDDRVLAWDLHNEPDNYPAWTEGRQVAIVDWLGRMRDALRAIDSRHPITVGVGRAASLWVAAPDGRTIADLSDVVSVHSYDAAAFAGLAAELRARTTRPLLLEEFGWPSGPVCRGPHFDDASQLYLYRKALEANTAAGFAGMLGWWYQDPPATQSYAVDENGHFGLYRRDGTPKPAVGPFRGWRVGTLPSRTTTMLPLSTAQVPPLPAREQPLVFDDGMVLRESFLHFWRFFGGEATFGRPITLAYRDASGMLVQYFERARFELNESEHVQPIDLDWPEGQTPEVYLDRVHLTPLGSQALAANAIPRVPDPRRPELRYFAETGHTLGGSFRALWETRDQIFFGPPLTEPLDELVDGKLTRVQYFTHWRFEQMADGSVRLGRLGVDALARRVCP